MGLSKKILVVSELYHGLHVITYMNSEKLSNNYPNAMFRWESIGIHMYESG